MKIDCPSGKIGYETRGQAARSAHSLASRKGGQECHEYLCRDCQKWHITRWKRKK